MVPTSGCRTRAPWVRDCSSCVAKEQKALAAPSAAQKLGTVVGRHIVIVHSLIKKTQETPLADLRLARKRVKEVHREK